MIEPSKAPGHGPHFTITRRVGEHVVLNVGTEEAPVLVSITLRSVGRGQAKLRVKAPRSVPVWRDPS
jgi:sRNA-binding carbon storage regulator CsrA